MNIQQHLTTNSLTWKEIELALFRALQNAFAELFTAPHPAEETASTKQMVVNKAKQRVRRLLPEVTRNNVPYLQQSSGTPIYHALSELKGW
ncbi:hypothetical protein B9L23_15605 [Parageobacillus galactosidasius]|uniref:Uncharacterized protein n=1 Tax=Parageobacillus galactosidasius TaxID=883812 RepID=A0A226QMH7_9BACL|nr:hypothetical protein B9L23_15605 [Parageobacillus galactosidasius]